MRISTQDWKRYINRLAQINTKASSLMSEWVAKNGFSDTEALISYAHALATKYGEGSAELACQMYDAIAEMEGASVMAAVPAPTATYKETEKAINESLFKSSSGQLIESTVGKLVKQPAADTMLRNARRDGAEFAWIPFGDTCPFCILLASNGWRRISRNALRNGHAEHIHANCDCQYCVRFNSNTTVAGYDPLDYYNKLDSYDGDWNEKVNAMRRENYVANKDKINAQKREAYAKRNNYDTIKATKIVEGHVSIPRVAEPNDIIDHIGNDSSVESRSFYDNDGIREKDIHTTNHGFPKHHDFGENGEHAHDYDWDGNRLRNKTTRELTEKERKENSDIL